MNENENNWMAAQYQKEQEEQQQWEELLKADLESWLKWQHDSIGKEINNDS